MQRGVTGKLDQPAMPIYKYKHLLYGLETSGTRQNNR